MALLIIALVALAIAFCFPAWEYMGSYRGKPAPGGPVSILQPGDLVLPEEAKPAAPAVPAETPAAAPGSGAPVESPAGPG